MSDQLGQLLGYFDSDGVTELVIHTGQPIHVRVHGEYRAVTEGAVSKPQLAHLMLGTPLDALTPEDERNSESRKLVLEGRSMHALLIKRGKEISLTIATTPPDSAPMPQYSSQITKPARPTSNTIAPNKPAAAAAMPVATPLAAPPPVPPAIPKPSPLPPKPRSRDESSAPVQIRSAPPPKDEPAPAKLKLELDDEDVESTSVGVAIPTAPVAVPAAVPVMKSSPVAAPPPAVGVKFAPPRPKTPTPPPPQPESAPPLQRQSRAVSIAELDDDSDIPDLDTGLPRGVTQDISAKIGEGWVPELEPSVPRKAKDEKSAPRPMPSVQSESRGTAASSDAGWQRGGIDASAFELDDSVSLPLETESRFEPPPAARFEPPPPVVAAPKFEPPPASATAPAPVVSTVGGLVDEPITLSPILVKIVQAARAANASDLHIAANRPLLIRTMSELKPLDGKAVTAAEVEAVLMPLLGPMRRATLKERGYVDLAVEVPGAGRLRANISRIQGGLKGAFRLALPRPFTLEELALPKDVAKVVHHHQGLVVIAGPSGHGKTTTLAALVDLVNSTRPHHILTVEDPVEIEHPRKAAVVSQREVGKHTKSFAAALKASLREDPDVIVIGELRDRETVEIALTAAETGHLVIATMSTPSAAKTIDRLIDMFPPDDQSQVRASLAGALRAIVAQRLVPTKDGKILPAVELLSGCLPLAVLIRDNKLFQLPNLMQRGRSLGMIRLDESLIDLFRKGKITDETALALADAKKEMTNALRGPAATPIPKVVK